MQVLVLGLKSGIESSLIKFLEKHLHKVLELAVPGALFITVCGQTDT